MRGFEKVPDALATDPALSLQARAVYPVLLYLAWQNGARAGERVELPPLEGIAAAAGCGVTALKGYVAELKKAGWVETRRAARGRPQIYTVHAEPREPESDPRDEAREPESGSRVGRNTSHSRARDPSYADTEPDGDYVPPPAIAMVDGRNLPLDALADECGLDPASPRYGQAIAALNGTRHPPKAGIRDLFWTEASRWADEHDETDRLAALAGDPEQFARALEAAVRRKAAKYREHLRGATLSPTALRDWWLDLELARRGNGGLSPEEIERVR